MTTPAIEQSAVEEAPAPPPETHQFDFWLGEWDATWEGGGGTNVIQSTFGGHVIEEQFCSEAPPLRGMSVSVYSRQIGKWHQTWVDDQGSYFDLIGEFKDSRMILAMEHIINAQPVSLRMVFFDITANQFNWNWEHSVDGGRTWQLIWHIHYTRKAGAR